ncbi:preprotein translocase subunit YajC [Allofustis seminis]|uniref:preprotein translocase subunit YajC n=1 Tax=Allofustis seminis TaxID=166939 RepID=UPI0003758002|nr:preprotein translocase subunit YajC [Allofustis seminis]
MSPEMQMLVSFLLMIIIFYFFMIRPNKKRMEQQKQMFDGLKVGDTVVTIGGLHGVIDEIIEPTNTIVLDCEGIYLTFERHAVARVIATSSANELTKEEIIEEVSSNHPAAPSDEESDELE